jgi:outer membrane immunogenic protein
MITVIRRRLGPILAAALLCTAAAHGQGVSPFEVSQGYSYLRANAAPGQCGCFSMNGGSGAFAHFANPGR